MRTLFYRFGFHLDLDRKIVSIPDVNHYFLFVFGHHSRSSPPPQCKFLAKRLGTMLGQSAERESKPVTNCSKCRFVRVTVLTVKLLLPPTKVYGTSIRETKYCESVRLCIKVCGKTASMWLWKHWSQERCRRLRFWRKRRPWKIFATRSLYACTQW